MTGGKTCALPIFVQPQFLSNLIQFVSTTGKWSETFSQYKFCLSTGPRPGSDDPISRGYLTVYRSIADTCDHHSEYVLSPVHGSYARFCIYNTQRGLYLS